MDVVILVCLEVHVLSRAPGELTNHEYWRDVLHVTSRPDIESVPQENPELVLVNLGVPSVSQASQFVQLSISGNDGIAVVSKRSHVRKGEWNLHPSTLPAQSLLESMSPSWYVLLRRITQLVGEVVTLSRDKASNLRSTTFET